MSTERGTARRRGRPKRPVLSPEGIYRGALRLIDESGLQCFSLPRLAAQLEVRPASLYNHVTGRTDVLDGVRDLILAEVDLTPLDRLVGPASVVQWAISYRAALTAHPEAAALFSTRTSGTQQSLRMFDLLVAQLQRMGCREALLLRAATTLNAFILGSALPQTAPDHADVRRRQDNVPHLRRALSAAGAQPIPGLADDGFEAGLRALLTGLCD